jgi:hypothetical protein
MQNRPELTFPDEVAALVRSEYEKAGAVLEYGSGGSTVLAAETPGLKCFSVESDNAWATGLQKWLDEHIEGHGAQVHYANIGATRDWGWPAKVQKTMIPRYLGYRRSVWQRPDFVQPDVILIDGRFRVGCFLTSISRIQKDTVILFDDYVNRSQYHVVEEFFAPTLTVGRMARFAVSPCRITGWDWLKHAKNSFQPS